MGDAAPVRNRKEVQGGPLYNGGLTLTIRDAMKAKELIECFEKNHEEYAKFEKIENKRSARADVHAFVLLDSLCPTTGNLIVNSEHDNISLGIDLEDLAPVITEEQIIELIRCGIRIEGGCYLSMFV